MHDSTRFLMAGTALAALMGLTPGSVTADPLGGTVGERGRGMIIAQAPEPQPPETSPKRPPGEPKREGPKGQPPAPKRDVAPKAPPAQPQPPAAQTQQPPPPPAAAPPPAHTEHPAPEPKAAPKHDAAPKKAPGEPKRQATPPAAPPPPTPPAAQTPPPPHPSAQTPPTKGEPQPKHDAAPKKAPGEPKRDVAPKTTPAEAPHQAAPPAPPHPPAPPAAQGTPPPAPPAGQGTQAPATHPPGAQGTQPPGAHPPAAQGTQPAAPPTTQQGSTPPAAPQAAPASPPGAPGPVPQQARPIAPAPAGAATGIAPQTSQGQPINRVEDLRRERREERQGDRTIIREPDRTIIREGNRTIIRHNEVERFSYGAQDVRTERRGSEVVTVVVRPGGDRIVTVLDDDGNLIRRTRVLPDGREIVIIENRRPERGASVSYYVDLPPPRVSIPHDRYIVEAERARPEVIYETLTARPVDRLERAYTLDEVRFSAPVRDRMPRVDLNTVTFDSGSWQLSPDQVRKLGVVAAAVKRAVETHPQEVFLIEGHTDAVGSDVDNLSLSDRRAETVAIALTQTFAVPAENLTTQGYGEQFLKVPTQAAERANRRVAVRRITPLLTGQVQ